MATRVLRERVLALAWGSALLLHVAEPRIAQGVAEHSVFLNNPPRRVARLYSTANTMLDLLVGGRAEMHRAAARINAIHDRVHGFTADTGAWYSAHDAALLAWVHVALHATLLRAYQALVGPLSLVEQDRYCREVASIEPLLGIPAGRLPRDVPTLVREFETRLPDLSVGDNARRIARGILWPGLSRWLSPVTGLTRLCTIGFLPAGVRRAYGLAWTPRRQRQFRAAVRVVRGLLPITPGRLRFVPPELMLRWAPCRPSG
jgi:uncharacterized protein (DUF2236 family)